MRWVLSVRVLSVLWLPRLVLVLVLAALASPAFAQSPSTAAVVVVVTDQTGGVIKDATITVVNTQTAATRDATTSGDGSATIPALPVAGVYSLVVSKSGFADQTLQEITLRPGETATLRVKLMVAGETANVTVFGTTSGVRANGQTGLVIDSKQIDETPILGRKVSSVPLLNSAFRSGKGTGDLFVNTTYIVTGAGGRRETTIALDGASVDEPWGRQTAVVNVPIGAVQNMAALTNSFSSEFGWTAGPAVSVVTKTGSNGLHGEGLYLGRPVPRRRRSRRADCARHPSAVAPSRQR
jgi:hypothetical protein